MTTRRPNSRTRTLRARALRSSDSRAALARALRAAMFVVACGVGVFGPRASAATLEDYRARVRSAYRSLEELWNATEPGGAVPGREHLEWEARLVGRVRAELPAAERVERAGGAVEVDNSWLHKELDAYAALPPDKMEEKEDKLALVGERLRVLGEHLDAELAPAAARDKEAEKGRLQAILRRPEYNEEAAKGGALAGFWEWLRSLFGKLSPEREPNVPAGSGRLFSVLASVFVYALSAALLIFVIWRFGPYLWGRFSTRRRESRARAARVVLGERLAPEQSASDLITEAEALARAGQLRAAIRKAYIGVLCDLGDRHVISLAQHKTNRDYLTSLRPRAELYDAMRPLTAGFERHWYGLAPASDADWAEYRSLCGQLLK